MQTTNVTKLIHRKFQVDGPMFSLLSSGNRPVQGPPERLWIFSYNVSTPLRTAIIHFRHQLFSFANIIFENECVWYILHPRCTTCDTPGPSTKYKSQVVVAPWPSNQRTSPRLPTSGTSSDCTGSLLSNASPTPAPDAPIAGTTTDRRSIITAR